MVATTKRLQQLRNAKSGATLYLIADRMNECQKNLEQILECLKKQNQAECNISIDINRWLTSLNNCLPSWSEQVRKASTILAGEHVEYLSKSVRPTNHAPRIKIWTPRKRKQCKTNSHGVRGDNIKVSPNFITPMKKPKVQKEKNRNKTKKTNEPSAHKMLLKDMNKLESDNDRRNIRCVIRGIDKRAEEDNFSPPIVKTILQEAYDELPPQWSIIVKVYLLRIRVGMTVTRMNKFIQRQIEVTKGSNPLRRIYAIQPAWGESAGKSRRLIDQEGLLQFMKSRPDGEALTKAELVKFLNNLRKEELESKNIKFDLHRDGVSDKTVSRYQSIISMLDCVGVTTKARRQNKTRYTASQSEMSAATHLMGAICATIQKKRSGSVSNTAGTHHEDDEFISKLFPFKWEWIHPSCIFNFDDTSFFASQSNLIEDQGVQLYKRDQVSCSKSAKLSQIRANGGLVIHTSHFGNADGELVAIFIRIDVSENELPYLVCPDGILSLEIPGLCIGNSLDKRNNAVGYVNFVRSKTCSDKANGKDFTKKIFEKVGKPFIERSRDKITSLGDNADKLQCSVSMDGASSQIKYFTGEWAEKLCFDLGVLPWKHSAAASLRQQPLDLALLFLNLKRWIKNKGLKRDRQDQHLRQYINKMIQSTNLLLPHHKKRALLDFLSTYPAMLTECASRQIIQDGFVRSGLIRKNMKGTIHPGVSICTCINTCQKARLNEDSFNRIKECVIRCFPKFFLEGECSDEYLHEHGGLPYDKDKAGNIVKRSNTGAQSESLQRTKMLLWPYQINLRKQKILDHQGQQKIDRENEVKKCQILMQKNHECEILLGAHFKTASAVEEFWNKSNKINKELFMAFVHCRLRDTHKPRGLLIGKKDDVVKQAFTLRATRCILKEPALGENEDTARAMQRWAKIVTLKFDDCSLDSKMAKRPSASSCIDNLSAAWIKSDSSTSSSSHSCPNCTGLLNGGLNNRSNLFSTWNCNKCTTAIRREDFHYSCDSCGTAIYVECAEHYSSTASNAIPTYVYTRADKLATKLLERLNRHIMLRCCESDQMNLCWTWVTENIPQMSAILMKRGFVIPDIECATQTSCFLVKPGKHNIYQAIATSNKHMEGCYLFFSSNEHKWIRSGSVAKHSAGGGASFGARLKQHSVAAKKGESRFYKTYPSRYIEDEKKFTGFRGHFEDLQCFIGFGFDRRDNNSMTSMKNELCNRSSDTTMGSNKDLLSQKH